MQDQNLWQELTSKIEENGEKIQAQKQAEAIVETVGSFRRVWREIRLGLLEEGVPEDLVDDAVLTFLKSASK